MEFFSNPEEFKQALAAKVDHAQMEEESYRIQLKHVLEELKPTDLITIRELIYRVGQSASYGSYVSGTITGILEYKHHVCASCAEKHDELIVPDEPLYTADTEESVGTLTQVSEPPSIEAAAEWALNMHEYNVREPTFGEVEAEPGEHPVVCISCEMLYQSLEDRMLKAPGVKGCDGCQHKAKWG